MTGRLLA